VALWGQRRVQEMQNSKVPGIAALGQKNDGRAVRRQAIKKQGVRSAATTADLDLPQAPGVLQINTADRDLTAAFINTEVISKDTQFILQIYPPTALDSSPTAKPLEVTAVATEDLQPGGVFEFPKIPVFGTFWPDGAVTYNLIVDSNGTRTHSAGQFLVGNSYWTYQDLNVAPLIYELYENVVNRQDWLFITGQYSSDPFIVVINTPDLKHPLVVPSSAQGMPSSQDSIYANLSQVPGMQLDRFGEYVVTVGQAGWSDTRVYARVPWNPNSYDPAPPATGTVKSAVSIRDSLRKNR
jgi:hypothetical protein